MLERLVLSGRTERKGAKRRALVRPFGHDALKIRFVLYFFFIFYVRFFRVLPFFMKRTMHTN